jgi:Ala-tRNA(Pro) deacylase
MPMAMATRVKWFLEQHGVEYEVLPHPHTETSGEAASVAQVPQARVAKTVLLEDERGYVMAVLPASERIELSKLNHALQRELELASEEELPGLFGDCALGALPPLGKAYNIPTIVEDSLLSAPEVWFEAGDHEDLVHVRGAAFLSLLAGSRHGSFLARHH